MGKKTQIDGVIAKKIGGHTYKFSYNFGAVCYLEDRYLEDPKLAKRQEQHKANQVRALKAENEQLRALLAENKIEVPETTVTPLFLHLFDLQTMSHNEQLEFIFAMLQDNHPELTRDELKKRITTATQPEFLAGCFESFGEAQPEETKEQVKELGKALAKEEKTKKEAV